MAITLKDVAELAGVSRSAVSRTFTDGASVSKSMRIKVEKAANELGYSPNFLARSLTTQRTQLIGLVADNFQNPIFLEVFELFSRELQNRGLRPLLVNLTGETDPSNSLRMLKQYSVDGVIVASSTLSSDFAQAFHDADVPVVHSFGRYSKAPKVHTVGVDNCHIGQIAAKTLLARGYKNIAFLGGPENSTSTQDRFQGFKQTLKQHPEINMTYSFAQTYSFHAGRREMQRLLKQGFADAYFCGDDVLSMGAMSAINSAGLSVPNDIGIIGFNNMEMAAWESFELTTISQPISDIITASVDLIVTMLNQSDAKLGLEPKSRLFRSDVIERKTLRPIS